MEALEMPSPTIDPSAFVAPGVRLYGDVRVGADAVIMFGTVGRAEFERIEVGARSNVQDGSILHTDAGAPCLIGQDVTVGHAVVLHGARVGDHCLVGIGARVLNNSVMGEGSWIAAGSVLPEGKEIPAWTLAMGTPAKPVRELTDEEIERQKNGVRNYQQFAATYRKLLGTNDG